MGSCVAKRGPAHVIPKVKLCMHTMNKSVASRVCLIIYRYLKHSPDYIDSKYIWVHGSNSLGSSVFAEIPFLAFLALHREKKRCGQVGTSTLLPE